MPAPRPGPTMTEPPEGTVLAALYTTRWFDPHWRPREMVNHYCPRCYCNKSGDVGEPNPVTEACDDSRCVCHDEDLAFDGRDLP